MDADKKENKSLFKSREGKIIIILFVIVLLAVGAMDYFGLPERKADISSETGQSQNAVGSFRNMRIDRLLASVRQKKNSLYTGSDIDSAVRTVKEAFKKKPWYISLTKIYFDEEQSDSVLDGHSLSAQYPRNNIITIICTYCVYKDEADRKTGEYEDWTVILTRETDSGEWVIRDEGDTNPGGERCGALLLNEE